MANSQPAKPRGLSSRFDSSQQEAFLNLWRTYDCLKAFEDELFGQHGLSAQQYNALRLLRSVYPEGMPTLALGARLVSRAPDMTRLLDKLERRGLVGRKRRADNRRVVDVAITPDGMRLLEQLDEPVRQLNEKQLGHLSPDAIERLIALLRDARGPHVAADDPWEEHG